MENIQIITKQNKLLQQSQSDNKATFSNFFPKNMRTSLITLEIGQVC